MTFLNFIIPSSSPLISYSGQWRDGPTVNGLCASNFSQGAPSFMTNDTDATATLDFVGTSITIFGVNGPDNGEYSVQLDNKPQFIGNGRDNNNTVSQFSLWNAQNLSNSQHTVVIANKPTHQGKTFGLGLDCVSIGREIGPRGYTDTIFNVTLDDESPFIVYNGSWSSSFSVSAFNQSLHSTAKGGSSASLHFQGSSVELYGTGGSFQVQLDNQLPRNLVGPLQFDIKHGSPERGMGGPSGSGRDYDSQPLSTLLFYADGLDENNTHVVTLTNSKSMASLSIDFATVRGSQRFFSNTPSPNQNFTSDFAAMSKPVHSRTPVGVIIGGVVGGVTALIVLGFIAFIFVRRSRRSRHKYNSSTGESLRNARSGPPFGETPVGEPFMSFVTDTVYDHNYSASQYENTFAGSLATQHTNPFPVPTAI